MSTVLPWWVVAGRCRKELTTAAGGVAAAVMAATNNVELVDLNESR